MIHPSDTDSENTTATATPAKPSCCGGKKTDEQPYQILEPSCCGGKKPDQQLPQQILEPTPTDTALFFKQPR